MKNELQNSENFLKSILKKDSGFATPSNYFSKLEEKMDIAISEEKFPKQTGFSTPNNYFNNFDDSIFSKYLSPKKESKVILLQQQFKKIISVAAVAAILFTIGFSYYNTNKTSTVTFENLAQTDIESWLITNSNKITTLDIEEVLYDENLVESDFAFTEIDDEIIEDYLINQDNIDIYNEI